MDDQDWTVVTVKRGKSVSAGAKAIVPRNSGQQQQQQQQQKKLEESDVGRLKQLTSESRNEIVQKRVALGKNQVQLNQECRFPVNTIREIESGRLCPSIQQLNMLNRVLKASLKYDH